MAIDYLQQVFNKKKITVFGGSSMIGSHVNDILKTKMGEWGIGWIGTPPTYMVDLLHMQQIFGYFLEHNPDYVFNFAGYNGGIKLNRDKPYKILSKNTRMINNLFDACLGVGVKKLVSVLPSCSYPDKPYLSEADYWNGKPAESVACHGLAKRNLIAFSEQAKKQFGFNSINICLNTVYGPKDKFGENSKVIGSLIDKFHNAKKQNLSSISLYGNGSQLRGFIFVKDAARAIVECYEKYDETDPLNIDSEEISIKDLASKISKIVGYEGKIEWSEELGGQHRKMLDACKSKEILNYEPEYDLDRGLRETYRWFLENLS